jgi:hypothetical protein
VAADIGCSITAHWISNPINEITERFESYDESVLLVSTTKDDWYVISASEVNYVRVLQEEKTAKRTSISNITP